MPPQFGPPALTAAEDRYHLSTNPNDAWVNPALHAARTPVEAVVARAWRHPHDSIPHALAGQFKGWPDGSLNGPAGRARVDHGRWLVDCPFDGCNSAQYASRTDRRFFCTDCGNGGSNKWVPVIWPADADVALIEAALTARPDEHTRHWRPGETAADLLAENHAHELG